MIRKLFILPFLIVVNLMPLFEAEGSCLPDLNFSNTTISSKYSTLHDGYNSSLQSLHTHSHDSERASGCHDSNCFGTAHFGHGSYLDPNGWGSSIHDVRVEHLMSAVKDSFIKVINLEGPFIPPRT